MEVPGFEKLFYSFGLDSVPLLGFPDVLIYFEVIIEVRKCDMTESANMDHNFNEEEKLK